MNLSIPSLTLAASCSISLVFAANINAATIVQGGSDNYIAWEAESDVSISNNNSPSFGWEVRTNADGLDATSLSPSGGAFLFANGTPGSAESSADSQATYQLQFAQAGTYKLYTYRITDQLGGTAGSGNSLHIFTYDNNTTATTWDNAGTNVDSFAWFKQATGTTFEISAGEVGTIVNFTVAIREAGYGLDRFVLSLDDTLGTPQLNSLANSIPEPSAAGLMVGVVAIAVACRRRR